MKLVFLSYAYPPLKFPRAIQVSRLVKLSRHSIRVLCGAAEGGIDPTISERECAADVRRLPRPRFSRLDPRYWFDRVPVPDAFRSWADLAATSLERSDWLSEADAIVTFGDPMSDHLAGLRLKRATGKPWAAHFSDPWADNPYRRSWPLLQSANRRLERTVIEAADRVIFTSDETLELVMSKYPTAWRGKGRVLPHAYDPSRYGESVLPPADELVIRHVGHFYPPRTPSAFLQALELLRQADPELASRLRVELVGSLHPACRPAILPSSVSIRPPVDYAESLALMKSAHILVVIDAPSDLSVFLPSKLIDYIGSGRPILAITPPGASAQLVSRLGGPVAPPDNPPAIAEALAGLLRDRSVLEAQAWGKADVRCSYEGAVVAKHFDDLMDEMLCR